MQYFKHGGTGREFVVLKKNQHIIGFCRINDASSPIIAQNVYWSPLFNEALGGIGPLGVDEQERGNGYGKMVVQAGIHYLRERGINRIVIDWTGLVNFYKQLDYGVWKSYWYYVKDLVK
ncbi:GNAT family N-acetyltransferase [Virgibacillus salarius]|uniref:GNAT family N-acetyltransferase n=1 Tax=Virgibacillus salarius TaxID=447199 RepID=UPI00248FA3D2|nr:GNAT family N-acetyltransferase [Virgibacillus salarius]WBX82247.1 GNAT family N-acetyltransferase [Virgibacillus salarius]